MWWLISDSLQLLNIINFKKTSKSKCVVLSQTDSVWALFHLKTSFPWHCMVMTVWEIAFLGITWRTWFVISPYHPSVQMLSENSAGTRPICASHCCPSTEHGLQRNLSIAMKVLAFLACVWSSHPCKAFAWSNVVSSETSGNTEFSMT